MIKESPWVDSPVKEAPKESAATTPVTAPGVTQDNSYCEGIIGQEIVAVDECLGFVQCQNGIMLGSITLCSPGLVFDANMGICNWPSTTNICGFEFCPGGHTGYVPFEECTQFYYCKHGKVDGDIDVCPDGTLFDHIVGICNWASQVTCDFTWPETPPPTPTPSDGAVSIESIGISPKPTYGKVISSTTTTSDATASSTISSSSTSSMTSFQDHSVARLRFTPTDDTYVQEDQPYVNFNNCGTDNTNTNLCDPRFIVVDANKRFDGLLRFYVQGLEDRRVDYVKLRLYVKEASIFGGVFWQSNAEWHEDVVTWDSVPSVISNQPLAVVNGVLQDEWVEVDVTGLVQGDGPVSIRIISESDDNVMYSSKDNTDGNAPELIVGLESISSTSTTFESRNDETPTLSNTARIGPSDDAFVFAIMPDTNYGQHEDLKIDMDNGDKKSYLRFDLSRVHVDTVQSATLRLFATDSSISGGTFTTVTDSSWDEDTITYQNAPPADGLSLGTLKRSVEAGQWYELDITHAITASRPLTICILGNHDDKVMYSSKEGQHSPEIELTLLEVIPLSSQNNKVVELLPTDDATIVLNEPDTNFGLTDNLMADTYDGMQNFLMRFDASNVPPGEVKSAVLRLYALNEEPTFGGTFVETRRTKWDESTVTWNSAPSADGRVMGSLMEVEYGSYYTIDVTSAVIGGTAVSFRVSSPHYNGAMYGSKEFDNGPRLIIQYSPPQPLPTDMDMYIPTDDASILMNSPNKNFGRNSELKLDGHRGVFNSLLRFDLSEIEKGSVMQAKLRLYAVDGSPSGGTFVVTQNSEWTQHTVTWNTAPAADGKIITTMGEVVPYQWYEIDLQEILQDMGGEVLSIRMTPSHGLRCAYSSSEDRLGHIPQLLIKSDMFAGVN